MGNQAMQMSLFLAYAVLIFDRRKFHWDLYRLPGRKLCMLASIKRGLDMDFSINASLILRCWHLMDNRLSPNRGANKIFFQFVGLIV